MKDDLGQRMKDNYESRTRYKLPRRTYTIIRLDGKAFHSFTRSCKKPFDKELMQTMDNAALKTCEEIAQGIHYAYVQSDEVSILLSDFKKPTTDAWFDGNIQKMASVSASIMTAYFNQLWPHDQVAFFDARVFTIPDPVEVGNYFIWRQNDAIRNSIQMVAQSLYSHKELHGKSCDELQEMIFQKDIDWNDYYVREKRGRMIKKVSYEKTLPSGDVVTASKWALVDPPLFIEERKFLGMQVKKGDTND